MTIVTRWIIGAATVAALCLAAAGGAAMAARGEDDRPPAPSAAASLEARSADEALAADPPADPHPAAVLTLDAAVDILLEQMTREADRLEIPRARAEVLNASFRPGGPPQADVNVTDPVDISFKRSARTRRSSKATNVAEAQYQDAVRNAIAGLYAAYVDLQEGQERVGSSRASVDRRVRLLKQTQERAKPAIEADDRILIQVIAARQTLFNDKVTMRQRRDSLVLMLGLPPDESRRIEAVESLRVPQPAIPTTGLLRLAMRARPDLAAYRLGLTSAEAAFQNASNRANRSASVYQLYQPYSFGDDKSTDREVVASWALGVTVPLPVYSRDRGNIERARLNLEQTRRQVAAQEKAIAQEVGERCGECERTHAEFRGISIALQRRKRVSQEAERRERADDGTSVDVVNAWHDLEKAEREYIEFLARHRRSELALNTAVGLRLFP